MKALHVGQLLNLALERSRTQERLPPLTVTFPVFKIVRHSETGEYTAVPFGRLTAVQTAIKVSPQKFTDKATQVTAKSFEKLVASEKEASQWRDRDVVRAALEWCRVNQPRSREINTLNAALLVVLASAHGCPATGARGDFDLLRAGSYIDPPAVEQENAVESAAVESTVVAA
jgi:hypothetical protein